MALYGVVDTACAAQVCGRSSASAVHLRRGRGAVITIPLFLFHLLSRGLENNALAFDWFVHIERVEVEQLAEAFEVEGF